MESYETRADRALGGVFGDEIAAEAKRLTTPDARVRMVFRAALGRLSQRWFGWFGLALIVALGVLGAGAVAEYGPGALLCWTAWGVVQTVVGRSLPPKRGRAVGLDERADESYRRTAGQLLGADMFLIGGVVCAGMALIALPIAWIA